MRLTSGRAGPEATFFKPSAVDPGIGTNDGSAERAVFLNREEEVGA
jgi:hypothetical protein